MNEQQPQTGQGIQQPIMPSAQITPRAQQPKISALQQPVKKEKYGHVNITLTIINILLALSIAWALADTTSAEKTIGTIQQNQVEFVTPEHRDYQIMENNAQAVSEKLGYSVTLSRYGIITILNLTESIQENKLNYCAEIGGLVMYGDGKKVVGLLSVVALISDEQGIVIKEGRLAYDDFYEQEKIQNIQICDEIDLTNMETGKYTLTVIATDKIHGKISTKEAGFTT